MDRNFVFGKSRSLAFQHSSDLETYRSRIKNLSFAIIIRIVMFYV